ncbi:MAG: hypothetical protein ACLQOO_34100 [Terriglobia bacterium]
MKRFDRALFRLQKVALEAHIATERLDELRQVVWQDFPRDEMMCELHLLRACLAIRDGVLSLEEALRPEPATGT